MKDIIRLWTFYRGNRLRKLFRLLKRLCLRKRIEQKAKRVKERSMENQSHMEDFIAHV
jgi:hypothetical protein